MKKDTNRSSLVNDLVKINIEYWYELVGYENIESLISLLKEDVIPPVTVRNILQNVELYGDTEELLRLIYLLSSPKLHWRHAVARKFNAYLIKISPF